MSIGLVMFWKAVVIAVWLAVLERYQSFKRKRRDLGLPMKADPVTGVYSVADPFVKWERRLKIALWVIGVPFALYGLLVVYLIVVP